VRRQIAAVSFHANRLRHLLDRRKSEGRWRQRTHRQTRRERLRRNIFRRSLRTSLTLEGSSDGSRRSEHSADLRLRVEKHRGGKPGEPADWKVCPTAPRSPVPRESVPGYRKAVRSSELIRGSFHSRYDRRTGRGCRLSSASRIARSFLLPALW